MANPTGGVKKLVCKTTAKRIVNQIGSKFRLATIGETNGSIISVSSIQSKKKYVSSNNKTKKKNKLILFIHIPKAAGTTIEEILYQNNSNQN